jgi:hypothetical protein
MGLILYQTNFMNNGAIQATPKEFILPTGKLLDLLIPILLITSQKKPERKKVNEYIYRSWRNPNKTNVIEGIKITYKGQSGGLGSQHEWRVDITGASDRLKKVFEEFQRSSRLPVPVQPPQHNQGQNGTFEWNGLFFRSPAEVEIAKVLDRQSILFFPNSRCRVPTRNNHQDTILSLTALTSSSPPESVQVVSGS